MASVDIDVEGAFTHGDPEAVLDLLAIRSLRMRRSEDDVSEGSVPIFPSETDMEAFVRNFTIDDTISTCFADVPSSGETIPLTSNTILVASRPEKKLIGSAAVSPHHLEQPPESAVLVQAKDNADTKPRGFLASLLARGVRGRRAEVGKRSVQHPGDVTARGSNQPPPSGLPLADEASASLSRDSAARGHIPRDLQITRGLQIASSTGNLGHSQRGERTAAVSKDVRAVGSGLKRDGVKTVTAAEFNVYDESTRHPKGRASGEEQVSLASGAASGKRRISPDSSSLNMACTGKVTNARDSNNFAALLLGQQFPHEAILKRRVSKERQSVETELDFLRGKTRHEERGAKNGTNPTPVLLMHSKLWEGWGDGVESFIDFERDPKLEMPVDPHLPSQCEFESDSDLEVPWESQVSSQLDFERGPRENRPPDSDRIYEVLVEKRGPETCTPVTVTSEIPPPISTSSEQSSRAFDAERMSQASGDESAPASSPTSSAVTSLPPESAVNPTRVSASTQTEVDSVPWSEADWKARAVHCLQAAVTQLSTLSACSACEGVVSRTMGDLQRILMEVKGEDQSSGDLGYVSLKSPSVRRGHENHNTDSSGTTRRTDPSVTSTAAGDKETETDEVKSNRAESSPAGTAPPPNVKEGAEGGGEAAEDVNDHHSEAIAVSEDAPTYQALGGSKHSHATSSLPPCGSNGQLPEQPGPQGEDTFVTSPRSSHDGSSDSDSASTVTSEPTTVRMRQTRRNRGSPPDVSHAVRPPRSSHSCEERSSDGLEAEVDGSALKMKAVDSESSASGDRNPQSGNRSNASGTVTPSAGEESGSLSGSRSRRQNGAGGWRSSEGGADGDCESFLTSTWSEMTSVSSVCDVVTSADESSYYSGDDDGEDEDDDEEEDEDGVATMVRLGLQDEDQDDNELRHQRLQRHLAAVLRQSTAPEATLETVVAATGERLNSQERHHVIHVNRGAMYPFSASNDLTTPPDIQAPPLSAPGKERGRGDWARIGQGLVMPLVRSARNREARPSTNTPKKGGATPRLFNPDQQVSLVEARQMTSDEFRESYDRSCDVAKVKRSQLDGDIPWDLLQFSDTDDDAGSEKAWYDVSSEEESGAQAYSTDTDSSVTVSDW